MGTVQFVGLSSLNEKVIRHGPVTLVRVSPGEVAAVWQNSEPVILDTPGLYGYDNPDFKYVRHQPMSEKILNLGRKRLVTVSDGEVCISHQHGALRVLEPGRHMLQDPSHIVDGFLPKDVSKDVGYHLPGSSAACGCCAAQKSSPTRISTRRNPRHRPEAMRANDPISNA